MASALIALVLLVCTMTYLQERSANNVMLSLKKLMPNQASLEYVLKPGQLRNVRVADMLHVVATCCNVAFAAT